MVTEARETDSNNILLHVSFSNIYITGKSLDNVTPVRRRNARDTVGQKDGISPFNTGLIDSLELSLKADDIREKGPWRPFSFEQTTVHIPAPWQLNPVGGEVNTWAIEGVDLFPNCFKIAQSFVSMRVYRICLCMPVCQVFGAMCVRGYDMPCV